eukprot:TRINITY_DN11945_c0_g1_i6.p1 TRINITY_DN11945_c0_g1~~TRINITY_DN11945_c0_g1_i6.p1  ORF type:complete len:167 (+),score=46.18 TRINITY_DN11945_c0_g1_i6:795-1295(+)
MSLLLVRKAIDEDHAKKLFSFFHGKLHNLSKQLEHNSIEGEVVSVRKIEDLEGFKSIMEFRASLAKLVGLVPKKKETAMNKRNEETKRNDDKQTDDQIADIEEQDEKIVEPNLVSKNKKQKQERTYDLRSPKRISARRKQAESISPDKLNEELSPKVTRKRTKKAK